MLKTSPRGLLSFALIAALASAGMGPADDRTPDKILAEIKGVEMPKIPANRQDPNAIQAYRVQALKAMEKKAALIGELYKADPENVALAELLPQRWQSQMMKPGNAEALKAEVGDVAARSKNPKLVAEAEFVPVIMAFREAGPSPDLAKITPVAENFIKKFPKDERGAMVLASLAEMNEDDGKKDAIQKRLIKDYPNSGAAKSLAGTMRQKEAVGKPFEISFVDAIKGSQVSSKTLMGKVVVIDFWATWCGPCVAEMPKMKDLYAKYKDQGVEFVGVSLDQSKEQGGYDKLKDFVEKNKIEWPQFYQGNYWQSEFSSSWGINSIPCVFLVDAEGKLASVEARGKLESMIPEYLEKAKKPINP